MYGVKIQWPDGDWTWVTKGDHGEEPTPLLFETEEQADEHASLWRKPGKERYVRVVSYEQ